MADHELFLGADDEREYLLWRWDDGTVTLATRPIGADRWPASVPLTAVPAEVTC